MWHTACGTEWLKWPGSAGPSTYRFSEKDYLSLPEAKDRQNRGDNTVITSHMTYCLLGLASHCDLCIHPGGEISMSGMIIANHRVCVCVCTLLCAHMYSPALKKSLNPLNRCLQNNLQQFLHFIRTINYETAVVFKQLISTSEFLGEIFLIYHLWPYDLMAKMASQAHVLVQHNISPQVALSIKG